MTAGTLTSRILGFVKAALLAAAIGVTAVQADAFDVANKVPNTLYMLLACGWVPLREPRCSWCGPRR